jgi:NADPH:quinone reductase
VRAALIERVGALPAVREAAEPVRGPGQAVLEVTAAPINPIDVSIAAGRFYGGLPSAPYVPGVEGLGRVLEGERLRAGARVYVETGGGRSGPGSLAERVAVDESAAIPVPDGADDALAACLGVAGLAAWLALEWRAELRQGETVLVLGASGAVGQIAVQAAKLLGAGRVVAAARDREALERTRALGADAVVALGAAGESIDELAETLREAAGGDGPEVTVDPLWGEPMVAAAKASAPGGRIVQLGQSAAPEATLASATVRGRTLSILGHSNFAVPGEVRASAYRGMVEQAAAGRLTVEHDVLPLERVAEAWERQAASPRRKLVLRP